MRLRTHCQRVSYLFLLCLGQDVFISCTLSYTAPDEIKAADNPDASSKNVFLCLLLFVCLFVCFLFFVFFVLDNEPSGESECPYLLFLHDNTNH